MTWREAEDVLDRRLEAEPGPAAGVGLVAAHDRRPLLGAHGRGAAVGEQVDEDVLGLEQEDVVARLRAGAASRSAGVVRRIGSTVLILNGSMMVFMGGEDTA